MCGYLLSCDTSPGGGGGMKQHGQGPKSYDVRSPGEMESLLEMLRDVGEIWKESKFEPGGDKK